MAAGDGQPRRIGFVGLGRMGMPMCARLIRAGFAVTAFDIRAGLRPAVQRLGAEWAASTGSAGADADVLITMLPGPAEVCGVIAEIMRSLPVGATWIDMSTASPDVGRQVAAAAASRGVRSLEAPVGGGPSAARDGKLIAFVGGSTADVEAQQAVLNAVAERVLHVGATGTGYTVKLIVNLMWFGQALASAEAMTLAHKAGVDPDVLREALGHSAAATRFLAEDADALLSGDDLTSFSLGRCVEELESVIAVANKLGVPLELGALIEDLYRQALDRYGDVDGELLGARFIAERAGVTLRR